MQPDDELNEYHAFLVESLRNQRRRRREASLASLQVFADHRCIGTMDCGSESVQFSARVEGPIHAVELRGESGLLVGSLVADEIGATKIAFPGRRYRIDAVIHNEGDQSTLNLHYHRPGRFARMVNGLAALLKDTTPEKSAPASVRPVLLSRPALAAVQIAIAAALLFLVNDRLSRESAPEDLQIRVKATEATMAAQKQMIDRFYQSQAATMRLMEEQVGELRRAGDALAALNRSHQRLGTVLAAMEQKIEKQDTVGKMVRTALRKSDAERLQMQAQLKELSLAKVALDDAVHRLEKRELAQGLNKQVGDLAKILTPAAYEQPAAPKREE